MHPKTSCVLATVLLAIPIGVTLDQLTGSPKVASAQLGALPGRGLEKPWWEAVSFKQSQSEKTIVIPADVLFASNSSTIDIQGASTLDGLVPQLKSARSVTIAGCTDGVGGVDSPYNVNLGGNRAIAAENALEAAGLPASLFQVVSWADTHPVSNVVGLDPATVNALNRRIVLIVSLSVPDASP